MDDLRDRPAPDADACGNRCAEPVRKPCAVPSRRQVHRSRDVLEQEAQKTTELAFSRHAAGRVAERGIEISRTGNGGPVWKKDSGWPGKRA